MMLVCWHVQLDILVVSVDYQKQLIADSPDFENTRGTVLYTS